MPGSLRPSLHALPAPETTNVALFNIHCIAGRAGSTCTGQQTARQAQSFAQTEVCAGSGQCLPSCATVKSTILQYEVQSAHPLGLFRLLDALHVALHEQQHLEHQAARPPQPRIKRRSGQSLSSHILHRPETSLSLLELPLFKHTLYRSVSYTNVRPTTAQSRARTSSRR